MRTRFKAISIALSLSVIVAMVPMETASGYGEDVHMSMTELFVGEVLATKYPNSEPLKYIDYIVYGAYEEDRLDLVYGFGGSAQTVTHFWDADEGPDHFSSLDGSPITGPFPNAWYKITTQGDYRGLWHQALDCYIVLGEKEMAYIRLGHIVHLIQDMSVPAHIHDDFHPTDVYDDTVTNNWGWAWASVNQTELAKGLIDCWNKPMYDYSPSLSALYYLLYTTNQRADFFGSDDCWGDINVVPGFEWVFSDFIDYPVMAYYQEEGNMEFNLRVCGACSKPLCREGVPISECPYCQSTYLPLVNTPTWISTQYLMPYAIRAAATMLEVFLKEVDKAAPTTTIGIGLNKYITSNNDVYISPDTTVTLTATDDAAGVKETMFGITGGGYDSDLLVYSTPFTFNQVQAGLADGSYTILYWSADNADHLEAYQSKEVYLTTKPGDYRVSLSTGGSYLGIQAAIDAAPNGSTIEVKAGTFRECVDFKGKAITLRGIGGPEVTTINADGGLHVVTFANAEGANSILDGFTITGGNAGGVDFPNDSGAGILCNGTEPVICNCIITNNYAESHGGGVYFKYMNPLLRNCLIYNNTASNGGGLVSELSRATITNCTFSANVASVELGGAIAAYANDYTNAPILRNCILWGNTPQGIACNFQLVITGSDVQNLHPVYYPYNLTCDPKFVDAANGNFRLAADSLCIGTGDNITSEGQTDLDGYPRILDGRCAGGTPVVDMGAFEFSYAYHGDLDANCTVDFADLAILAAAWMHEPADRTIDIEPVPAGDGTVNILDFSILAEHWMKEI